MGLLNTLFLLFCRLNFGLPLRRRHSLGSVRWCVGFAYSYWVRNAPANITALTTTRSSLSLSSVSPSHSLDEPSPRSAHSCLLRLPAKWSTDYGGAGASRSSLQHHSGPEWSCSRGAESGWVGAATVEQGEAISFRSRFRRYRHGCC